MPLNVEDFFGLTDWRVQGLFTLGNVALRPRVKEVALGSLLHEVQHSLPKGHVDRAEATLRGTCAGAKGYFAPGRVREFHAYNKQDTAQHADYDSRKASAQHSRAARPNVAAVSQLLLDHQKSGPASEEVRPYVDCVFALEDPEAKGSPGAGFKRE
jgi:hypothetical protein